MNRTERRPAWNDVAETYARRRDADGSDAALIDNLLADLPPDPDVLDIGCGDGARTLANLPPGSVGLDISGRGLELATDEVPDARRVQGDMSALPVGADRFDGLTAYHAVFHVPREEQPAVYEEFARVLRPGGVALMTLPGVGSRQSAVAGWAAGCFSRHPGENRRSTHSRRPGSRTWRRQPRPTRSGAAPSLSSPGAPDASQFRATTLSVRDDRRAVLAVRRSAPGVSRPRGRPRRRGHGVRGPRGRRSPGACRGGRPL